MAEDRSLVPDGPPEPSPHGPSKEPMPRHKVSEVVGPAGDVPVRCWVFTAPGLPVGGRILGKLDGSHDRLWVNINVLGQHLPQQYRQDEIRILNESSCEPIGLCKNCFGYGDMQDPEGLAFSRLARGIHQFREMCLTCRGSGRPAVEIGMAWDEQNGLVVTHKIHPHPFLATMQIPPEEDLYAGMRGDLDPAELCSACSAHISAANLDKEPLHVAAPEAPEPSAAEEDNSKQEKAEFLPTPAWSDDTPTGPGTQSP